MRGLARIRLATVLLVGGFGALGSVAATSTGGCGGAASLSRWTQALPEASPTSRGLLARARDSLRGGTLSPELEAELLASTAPEHARARELLAALRAPLVAEPSGEVDGSTEGAGSLEDAPRLQLATPPPEGAAARRPARTASSRATRQAPLPPRVPAKVARTTLDGLGLKSTNRGATLSLRGSGGLVVGIANQPQSGIVRLVMDADASTAALRSRPTVRGAKVTGVRRTGKTVFVTLALDPGWSLRGIVRTSRGARVDLRRPA